MISSIIDSDGFLVYAGNDVNEKFSIVLARPGHTRVDSPPNVKILDATSKIKWDGAKWVEEKISGMPKWLRDMRSSDKSMMSRDLEDLITDNPTFTINEYTKIKYDDKVALRATKPEAS